MEIFQSGEVKIAYEDIGAGRPVVLVHGFASDGRTNWRDTGWVQTLNDAGYRCVVMDNRGHGKSQKLYDPAFYPAKIMAGDVAGLIEHLDLGSVPVIGYSMGARIAAFVALNYPQVINGAVFGGLGINMIHGLGGSQDIVEGLLAPSLGDVKTSLGRRFRIFAEQSGGDLRALAACMASSRDPIGKKDMAGIKIPVLVAVGSDDEIGGSAKQLADLLPNGEALDIPNRDHMRATGDRVFKVGVLDFLARITS
jgi:pimeloyl-ACP methyl ester carboxylesterase